MKEKNKDKSKNKKKKRKLLKIFGIITTCLVTIAAVLGVTAIVFYIRSKNAFDIANKAGVNVCADIELSWIIVDEGNLNTLTANDFKANNQTITFNTEDKEEIKEKNFNNVIESLKSNQVFVMRYFLKNNDAKNSLKLTIQKPKVSTRNMMVGYAKQLDGDVYANITDIVPTNGNIISTGGSMEMFVVINIIENSQLAYAIGSYTFELSAVT